MLKNLCLETLFCLTCLQSPRMCFYFSLKSNLGLSVFIVMLFFFFEFCQLCSWYDGKRHFFLTKVSFICKIYAVTYRVWFHIWLHDIYNIVAPQFIHHLFLGYIPLVDSLPQFLYPITGAKRVRFLLTLTHGLARWQPADLKLSKQKLLSTNSRCSE